MGSFGFNGVDVNILPLQYSFYGYRKECKVGETDYRYYIRSVYSDNI